MKENSIEKDIKIVNNFITYFNKNIQTGYKADLTVLGEEIEAIDHILSDYKRALKENEELKNKYATFIKMSSEVITNSIPVQKIKDKIEELEDYIQENSDEQGYWGNINPDIIYKEIDDLQEMLESED